MQILQDHPTRIEQVKEKRDKFKEIWVKKNKELRSRDESGTSETSTSSLSTESLPQVIILKHEIDFAIFLPPTTDRFSHRTQLVTLSRTQHPPISLYWFGAMLGNRNISKKWSS